MDPDPQEGAPSEKSIAPAPPSAGGGAPRGSGWGDFFAFRVMVTPALIRVVYVIGAVVITAAAILIPLLGTATTVCQGDAGGALACTSLGAGPIVSALLQAIVVFVVAQVCWRVLMELLIVIFGIHESVRSIEARGGREATERPN